MAGGRRRDVCAQALGQETFLRAELVTSANAGATSTHNQIVRPKRDERSDCEDTRGVAEEENQKETKKKTWKGWSEKNREKTEKRNQGRSEEEQFWNEIAK